MLASGIIAAADPRPPDRFSHKPTRPALEELLASFLDADEIETTALLIALATIGGDRPGFDRIPRELAERHHPLPHWLERLSPFEVHRTGQMKDVLGDGEDVILGFRTGTAYEFTAVVYIDHNMGTIVKDAFVTPEPIADVLAEMRGGTKDEPDVTVGDLDPAEAAARISQALVNTDMIYPPIETETWPFCRPVVEWALHRLPPGGTGFVRPEWSERDRTLLIRRFLASPHAAGLDDARCSSRCSGSVATTGRRPAAVEPVVVEIVPWTSSRKVMGGAEQLWRARLLRAFIRFAHAERDPFDPHRRHLNAVDQGARLSDFRQPSGTTDGPR